MGFPLAQAPLGYPISLGAESLPTPPGTNADIMGRNTIRHPPMRDYVSIEIGSYPTVLTQLSG